MLPTTEQKKNLKKDTQELPILKSGILKCGAGRELLLFIFLFPSIFGVPPPKPMPPKTRKVVPKMAAGNAWLLGVTEHREIKRREGENTHTPKVNAMGKAQLALAGESFLSFAGR